MKLRLRTALGLAAVAIATQAVAQVTFYENDNFRGRTFTTSRQIPNFDRFGFNDRASSVVVKRDRWEVCEDVRFNGRCVILRPGQYPSLAAMGLNDRVSSVRTVGRNMRIEEDRFGFEPEVTAKTARLKVRIFEVPISYYGRTYAEGKKINWRDGFRALWCILKYNFLR